MANTYKKMISQLTQACSNASVAQLKSILQQESFSESKEFFCSQKWKKMVVAHSKHLIPCQAFGFGTAILNHFYEEKYEEKPFQYFFLKIARLLTHI